jgi:hypothetical protein
MKYCVVCGYPENAVYYYGKNLAMWTWCKEYRQPLVFETEALARVFIKGKNNKGDRAYSVVLEDELKLYIAERKLREGL